MGRQPAPRRDAINEVSRTSQEVAGLCARIEATPQLLHDLTWALSAVSLSGLPAGYHRDGMLWGRDRGSGAPWKEALRQLEVDPDAMLPQPE